jgi:uncharacterized protein
MMRTPTLNDLRRYAIARSLFTPTTLRRAIDKLGFVQADPIRAPARAQDLTLRHRVKDYCAGDLERRYATLGIEEDFFVNYGFLRHEHQVLLHPRTSRSEWTVARQKQAQAVLEFVCAQGTVHPRVVDAYFAHGKSRNWFGGSSNASTQLLDAMHYRGMLRVVRRDSGVRVYAAREPISGSLDRLQCQQRVDRLVELIVRKYAPLPAASLGGLVSQLMRTGTPQWNADRKRALDYAKQKLAHASIDGIDWYWPLDENPLSKLYREDPGVRLLAPFDPIVWDRRRFEIFWGWAYRFEAYTPAPKRKLGYYALPLLWGGRVVGWGNLQVRGQRLMTELGYVHSQPRTPAFKVALEDELERMDRFLGL